MTRGRVINSRHGFSGEEVDVLYIDDAIDRKGKVGLNAKHENIPCPQMFQSQPSPFCAKKSPSFPLTASVSTQRTML